MSDFGEHGQRVFAVGGILQAGNARLLGVTPFGQFFLSHGAGFAVDADLPCNVLLKRGLQIGLTNFGVKPVTAKEDGWQLG